MYIHEKMYEKHIYMYINGNSGLHAFLLIMYVYSYLKFVKSPTGVGPLF